MNTSAIPDIHLPTVYAAKKVMQQLKLALRAFNDWWPTLAHHASVSPLPVTENTQPEYVPWLPALTDIQFETLKGEDAIEIIRHELINFSRHPNDPALNIRRFPGYVFLPSAQADKLAQELGEINRLKTQLMDILSVIPDGSRVMVLPKAFPGEHILLAYRHIHAYTAQDVRRLAFGWQGKFPKNIAISRQQIREKLQQEEQHHIAEGNVLAANFCQQDLLRLDALPADTSLVERKLFAPSPRLRLLNAATDKPALVIQAALPLFVAQDRMPLIKPLGFYRLADQQKKELKKTDYLPFIERHRVFIKQTIDTEIDEID